MQVWLFDIDGTLAVSGGAGGSSMEDTIATDFGVSAVASVEYSGRTDRGIVGELFERHGLNLNDATWLQFCSAYLERLEKRMVECDGRVLEGARALLERCAASPHIWSGLLTGNMRDAAMIKMRHFKLDEFFAFGGFGDNHPERNRVAEEALASAAKYCSRALTPQQDVWVIGDTVRDIACARHIGARVVAVATGGSSMEELIAAEPDLAIESLEDPRLLDVFEF